MARADSQGNETAERHAADRRALDLFRVECRDDLCDVIVQSLRRIQSALRVGLAAEWKGDHAERRGQRLDRRTHVFPSALDTGDENQRVAAAVFNNLHHLLVAPATTINAELAEPAEKTGLVLRVLRFLR